MRRVWALGLVLVACGEPADRFATGAEPIKMGTPATAYPEAVFVTSSGFIPCSGVVLAPKVVLTAGHCRSKTLAYLVNAPHAGGQTAHGVSDWSPFTGDPAKSPDVLLVLLDSAITLESYPTFSKTEVARGTRVVDLGRALNGAIESSDYVSPPVTILGPAAGLGFPYNYEATPDISEDGDSGGPIEIPGTSPHQIVAIVDTDTLEQNIPEKTPIDMFARLDVVADEIDAQMRSWETDGGAPGDAGHDAHGRANDASAPSAGSPPPGGCHAATTPRGDLGVAIVVAAPILLRRRRRRVAPRVRSVIVNER